MSFKLYRQRLEGALDGLELRRWEDGFDFENIPSMILDKSYHVEFGTITSAGRGSRDFDFRFPTTVRVYFAPQLNVLSGIDEALDLLDDIYNEVLDPAFRLQTDIHDIIPGGATVSALSTSNNNGVGLEIELIGRILKCY